VSERVCICAGISSMMDILLLMLWNPHRRTDVKRGGHIPYVIPDTNWVSDGLHFLWIDPWEEGMVMVMIYPTPLVDSKREARTIL